MTKAQAAHRLGVAEHEVRALDDHPAGILATLRSGQVMLIAETVARVYVPEVDDAAEPEAPAEDAAEPKAAEAPAKPTKAAAAKKRGATGASTR